MDCTGSNTAGDTKDQKDRDHSGNRVDPGSDPVQYDLEESGGENETV